MDYAWIWGRLVPEPKYTGSIGTPTFKWVDERPQPTEEECRAEWKIIQKEQTKKKVKDKAYKEYIAALNEGYNYNGVVYDCDNKFTTDLVKMVVLKQLTPEEPAYIMNKAGDVVTMSYDDFKNFAVALGYYVYNLRQQYWASIK